MAILTGFEIVRGGHDYLVHFNLDDGQTVEIISSFEQLDLIAEEMNRLLDRDRPETAAPEERDEG